MRRRIKAVLANLTLLAAASAAALVLAEAALRLGGGHHGDDAWRGVPPLEERMAHVPPKPPGQLRLVALGDSFTEFRDDAGQNWARIAGALARRDGVALDVWNLGQAGTGVPHYLKNLREHGRRLSPDVVAVGIYLGNDVFEYEVEARKRARGLPPNPVRTVGRRSGGLLAAMREHSLLLDRLVTLEKSLAAASASRATTFDRNLSHAAEVYGRTPGDVEALLARADAEIVRLARTDRINGWDLAWALVDPRRYESQVLLPDGAPAAAALEPFLSDLLAVEGLCREMGARCVHVLIPASLQVDRRYFPYFERLGYATTDATLGDSALRRRLRAFFDEHGLVAVDPTDALRASAEDAYLPMDTHLSVAGQEVVGREVYAWMRTAGFGPASRAQGSESGAER